MGIAACAGSLFFIIVFGVLWLILDRITSTAGHKQEQKILSKIAPRNATKGITMNDGKVTDMTCPYCGRINKIRINHAERYWDFIDKNKAFRFKRNYFYAKCNSCKNQINMEKVFDYLDSTYFQVYVYVVWQERCITYNAADEPEIAYGHPELLVNRAVVKGLRKAFELKGSDCKVPYKHRSTKVTFSHIRTEISTYGSKRTFLKFEDKDLSRIVLK